MAERKTVNVGIVGFGYWGPKLLRNFSNAKTTSVIAVCESDPGRRERAQKDHPELTVVADLEDLLKIPELDAVAIATPVNAHYPVAKQALLKGKHVFVEKPFTRTTAQAKELIAIAEERNLVIMVDHTFLFTAAVNKIRDYIKAGDLGSLLYYDSTRINLGLFQPDVDVIWDLAPHDFSILDYVIPTKPIGISVNGASHLPSNHCDVAYVVLDFGQNFIGHLHLNWLAPAKKRQILIGGSKKMIQFDDVEQDEKIRIYDRGIDLQEEAKGLTITPDDFEGRYVKMISYRTGDVHIPWLDRTEALFRECTLFGDAILNGTEIPNDGYAGLRVVALLEAASESLKNNGQKIEIDWHHQ